MNKNYIYNIVILFSFLLFAFLITNSKLEYIYYIIINFPNSKFNNINLKFLDIVNDILMTFFFIYMGKEIKYGLIKSKNYNIYNIISSCIISIGGIIVPAIIYLLINLNNTDLRCGWAIPTATDVVLVNSIINLFNKSIPNTLKLFLLIITIFDDLGSIIIVSLFYHKNINLLMLFISFMLFVIFYFLFKEKEINFIFYTFIGALIWTIVKFSGIHPSISGILISFILPIKSSKKHFNLKLKSFVNYLILPMFVFVNTGFSIKEIIFNDISYFLILSILVSFLLGKPIGISLFTILINKVKKIQLCNNINLSHVIVGSMLCSIGFTMSIFISNLAFNNNIEVINISKIGITFSSLISIIISTICLFLSSKNCN